jgi:hypothetical protein
MLDVEDTWRDLVYPWLIKNKPSFSCLRGHWGSDYCLDKFLQAVRENTASLPLIHGLISRCSTKINYYFLAVEDPEYQRWLPICCVDYTHVRANDATPVLILRKSDSQLGYLDRETLCFSQSKDISYFIWAKGSSQNTPIRVIDKSQSYISEVLRNAKKIYQDNLWNGNSDDDHFAQDTIISASELLPRWGSKEMFLTHLPIHAVAPQWAIEPDTAEIAKPFRIHLDDIQNFSEIKNVDFESVSSFLGENGRLEIPENTIKNALENILCEEYHKKDWGGEYNDLYTSNVLLKGTRRATAFLLKGNGLGVRTMEVKHCGKNGDQLIRLFESPAELFIIQFVGNISEAVVKDVEGKVEQLRARGKEVYYCIINGADTARLLFAYDYLKYE